MEGIECKSSIMSPPLNICRILHKKGYLKTKCPTDVGDTTATFGQRICIYTPFEQTCLVIEDWFQLFTDRNTTISLTVSERML